MTKYEETLAEMRARPGKWLVTGAAGFIGSHLVRTLLANGQTVVGLDNLSAGKQTNSGFNRDDAISGFRDHYKLLEGDIRDPHICREACRGIDYVLHQAAQVSVPASLENPMETHETNVTGFLNVLLAAKDEKVRRVVYASSCAIYGDSTNLPLTEDNPGKPLSPYAASKRADELYAESICSSGSIEAVGLRYFNVFGPGQNPQSVYAAVIPLWISAMIQNGPVQIFGDGSTTRDFCYIANVVQANLLGARASMGGIRHQIVNVAVGAQTSLLDLFELIRTMLLRDYPHLKEFRPVHRDFRLGDIRHSWAAIAKAREFLGYAPSHSVEQGLQETLAWYRNSPPC